MMHSVSLKTHIHPYEHRAVCLVSDFSSMWMKHFALSSSVSFSYFSRRLRKTNSQKVLICLAVSLLGLNLTFLIGIKQVHPPIACYTVAATLHYFLLCSFAWMLVEAILQYLR